MRLLLAIAIALLPLEGCARPQPVERSADSGSACSTPSPQAVTKLAEPLNTWGTVVCTPFGYIISNHEGWIWSKPGGYSPVFIPSQMVRNNPKQVGSESYFTHIEFAEAPLQDPSTRAALQEIQAGYTPEAPATAYRLLVRGSLGRQLVLYFFEWNEGSINGIWCGQDGDSCSSESMFMLLDMRKGS